MLYIYHYPGYKYIKPLIKKLNTYTMENFWAVLAALACLILTCSFISKFTNIFKPKAIPPPPPGPKPWPIIGNLNLLGSVPHQSFHLLSRKYGDIMQLKFGRFPVVIASSPEMAKHFLKTHDVIFASRPALAAGKYTAYNYSDMTWAPYGPYWRQARRIYMTQIFNPKTLESYENLRTEERRSLFSRLHDLSGKPVVLRNHLFRYTLSSISRMVFSSHKYFNKNNGVLTLDELIELIDEWFLLNGLINIGDWIPWLEFLDLQGYVKRMKIFYKKVDRFLSYVIDDHQATRDATKDFVPKDMVDVLIHMAEDPNLEVKLTRNCIKGLIQDLLAGGTDTSATTVEWAIHEIIKQPHIIEKAKEELDRVIGRNRWVEENDFSQSQLPYLDAIIMETMRLHPLTTLLAPHYATEDCNVAGYHISKGTTVMINTWSIGRDPNSWDTAEIFLPERFLGKEMDVTGRNFALLPFGSGRRRCPGYKLGLLAVQSTLANLLHGFDLMLEEGMKGEDVSMEEIYGLTTHPKFPVSIILEPTLPIHLYK